MTLTIIPQTIRCCVEIDEARFLDLLDSESYVTGHAAYGPGKETLRDMLLDFAALSDIAYDGHFGAAIYFTIDADVDQRLLAAEIEPIIKDHLDWCASLPKASHIIERRARRG